METERSYNVRNADANALKIKGMIGTIERLQAEIERLQAENARLKSRMDGATGCQICKGRGLLYWEQEADPKRYCTSCKDCDGEGVVYPRDHE